MPTLRRLLPALVALHLAGALAHEAEPTARMDFVPPRPGSYRLERIMAAPQGIVLDVDGRTRSLSEFTTGKITLLSLIYTHCGDEDGCPRAFGVFHGLKGTLNQAPELAAQVRLVSLSFDPRNDTPAVMKAYGKNEAKSGRGPRWHFLTTRSAADLAPILDGFGQDVSVAADAPAEQQLLTLTHLLKVFLIDRQGEVREIYTTSYLLPQVVLNDIRTLLMENRTRQP